jgi:hypothetical protein
MASPTTHSHLTCTGFSPAFRAVAFLSPAQTPLRRLLRPICTRSLLLLVRHIVLWCWCTGSPRPDSLCPLVGRVSVLSKIGATLTWRPSRRPQAWANQLLVLGSEWRLRAAALATARQRQARQAFLPLVQRRQQVLGMRELLRRPHYLLGALWWRWFYYQDF